MIERAYIIFSCIFLLLLILYKQIKSSFIKKNKVLWRKIKSIIYTFYEIYRYTIIYM